MCTHDQCLRAKKKKNIIFHLKINIFTAMKYCCILHGRVCVMCYLLYCSSLAKKKKGIAYESQELRMTFQEEIQGGIDLHNGPVHRDNGSYSMADSGIENLSQHSSDHNRLGSSSKQSDNRVDNHDKNTTGVAMVMDEERAGTSKHVVIKPRETDADNISRVSKVPVSTLEAPVLKFLNVEEAPMMTSTPYQSHTDISSHGTTEVILYQEHNRSDTESTTDILDVNKTIPGAESHDYENVDMHDVRKEGNETGMAEKEETTHEIIIESKDMNDGRIDNEPVKEDQVDVADPGNQSRGITLEEGDDDVLYRDRTLTLSFEEIGETNDEDESTQF